MQMSRNDKNIWTEERRWEPIQHRPLDDSKTRPTVYEYEIFTILSSACAWTSINLAGKRDSRLHSTTGFSENDVVRKRGYQILGVQHLINQALFFSHIALVCMDAAWNLIFPWFSIPNKIAYWRQRLNQPRLWLNICDFSATERQDFSFTFLYQQVAVIFTCSRLLQDATYSYLPLYLTKTQGFEKVRKTNIFSAFPSLLLIITFSLIYFFACRKEWHYINLITKDACSQRSKCGVANLN